MISHIGFFNVIECKAARERTVDSLSFCPKQETVVKRNHARCCTLIMVGLIEICSMKIVNMGKPCAIHCQKKEWNRSGIFHWKVESEKLKWHIPPRSLNWWNYQLDGGK